jgi:aminoglycoside phosphotransferase
MTHANQGTQYAYLHFPIALKCIREGQLMQARRCLGIALQQELTPKQANRLSNTTAEWIMSCDPNVREALLDALLSEMKNAAPHTIEFGRQLLAGVHHAWAFEAYASRQWDEAGRHVMHALQSNTALVRNRGLMSVLSRSALARVGYTKLASQTPPAPANAPDSCSVHAQVEKMMGGPLHDWRCLSDDSSFDKYYRVYCFSHGGIRFVARVTLKGALVPHRTVMEKVVTAGVPVERIVLEQDASPDAFAIRIKSFIEGEAMILSRCSQNEINALVAQLGEALQRLHGISVGGFGVIDQELNGAGVTNEVFLEEIEQNILVELFKNDLPVQSVDAAARAFELLDACPYKGSPVLCHGDLQPENIHVKGGRLSGLIDWEYAQGNDPAYDIARLIAASIDYWYPMHADVFMQQVVDASAGSHQPDVLRRVWAYTMLRLMFELPEALKYSGPHVWRNAGKVRDFLACASDMRHVMLRE